MRNNKWWNAFLLLAAAAPAFGAHAPGGAVAGPVVQVSPSSVNFGYITLGHFKIAAVTLTNIGSANLVIKGDQVYHNTGGQFGIDTDGCAGRTVSPGGSCVVQLFFSPNEPIYGYVRANYVVFDNAAGGYQSVIMYGTDETTK